MPPPDRPDQGRPSADDVEPRQIGGPGAQGARFFASVCHPIVCAEADGESTENYSQLLRLLVRRWQDRTGRPCPMCASSTRTSARLAKRLAAPSSQGHALATIGRVRLGSWPCARCRHWKRSPSCSTPSSAWRSPSTEAARQLADAMRAVWTRRDTAVDRNRMGLRCGAGGSGIYLWSPFWHGLAGGLPGFAAGTRSPSRRSTVRGKP